MEVKTSKVRTAVIKKTGGNLIWGSINKTTLGSYWFRLQNNRNCLLSAVSATRRPSNAIIPSVPWCTKCCRYTGGCTSQHRYAFHTYRLDATVWSLYTLLRYFVRFESSCWQMGRLLSLHCEFTLILVYPSIVERIKEMERRKCGHGNELFCFILKQEHK